MNRIPLVFLVFSLACSAATPEQDPGSPDAGSTPDAGTARRDVQEQEPNGGATLTEVNAISLADTVHGAIGSAGDTDIFRFDAQPGHLYRVTIHAPVGSSLDGRLTIIDARRGTKAPGEDFVQISRAPAGADAAAEFLAMGAGGHFLAVRDTRASAGGADATYELTVEELDLASRTAALSFPSTVDDALAAPGAVRLYSFDGVEGTNVRLDLHAKTGSGGLDARLFVFSVNEGSWIARNADRSASDADPLIDAPLTASGPMFLVVDNIEENATDLRYGLTAAKE